MSSHQHEDERRTVVVCLSPSLRFVFPAKNAAQGFHLVSLYSGSGCRCARFHTETERGLHTIVAADRVEYCGGCDFHTRSERLKPKQQEGHVRLSFGELVRHLDEQDAAHAERLVLDPDHVA